MSTSEANRQSILKQMKVRTTYKKDKSWIHQDSDDERDETHNQLSPQLKSLEGKKFLWSPTPDSKTERTSGTITASSPPVHARNKQNTYSSVETNKSTYVSSQPSPPPSTTGGTKTPSYIIRGQPFNSVSQVKGQPSYNGYQKSYSSAQPRTSSSLPRVPTATGYKMSTEEYKKLAPYNVRSRSVDLSDDETLYTQEQTLRTDQASKVFKSTPPRDSSYVTSAAKRSSGERNRSVDLSDDEGLITQEQPLRTEQTSKGLKSPPPLRDSSYVTSAAKRGSGSSYNLKGRSADLSDDETLYTQEQPPRTEQTSKMSKTSPPRDSSFVTSAVKGHSGSSYNVKGRPANLSDDETLYTQEQPSRIGTEEMSPFVAKRVQIKEENSPTKKSQTLPKTLSSYLYEDNKMVQTPEEENILNKKSQTLPKSLSSYLYEDNKRFENNWKETQSTSTTSQTTPPTLVTDRSSSPQLTNYSTSNKVETKDSTIKPGLAKVTFVKEGSENVPKPTTEREVSAAAVTTKKERVETTKKSDTLPESLASYLYDDVYRFEKNLKSNQPSQPTSQIVTRSVPDRPESPRLTSWNTHTESKTAVNPEPGRVTVFRESNTSQPNNPSITTSNTETKSSAMQTGPGKTAVLKEESKDVPDSLKLTSSSLPTSAIDSTRPTLQAGPGKVTVFRDKSDVNSSTGTNKSPEITTTTGRAKITIETLNESTSPKPSPRMETKPKEAATVKTSDVNSSTGTNKSTDITTTTTGRAKITIETLNESTSPKPSPRMETKPKEAATVKTSDVNSSTGTNKSTDIITTTTGRAKITIETLNESTSPKPSPRMETKPKEAATVKTSDKHQDLISWSDLDNNISTSSTRTTKEASVTPTPVPVQPNKASEKSAGDSPLTINTPELKINRTNEPTKPGLVTAVDDTKVNETRYRVPENLDEQEYNISNNKSASGSKRVTSETQPERPITPELRSSSPRPMPRPRESTAVKESRYRVPETLDDTMLQPNPSRSSLRTTVTTSRSTAPVYTEYTEDAGRKSSRTVTSSTEKTTTTTTTDTRYENSSPSEASHYDPQSPSNKGGVFVKEYVNSRESMKSPTTSGGYTDFLNDSERINYSSSSSYLYGSAPDRSDEGPCTYCGREIKDCPKIILEHLNIYCHEYCFKCGICNKPMGDLVDSLFIHRDVVHCESCYEKLF